MKRLESNAVYIFILNNDFEKRFIGTCYSASESIKDGYKFSNVRIIIDEYLNVENIFGPMTPFYNPLEGCDNSDIVVSYSEVTMIGKVIDDEILEIYKKDIGENNA